MVTGGILCVHNDGVAGGTGTVNGWTAVIGGFTVFDIAFNFTVVIFHTGNRQTIRVRTGIVGGQDKVSRWRAGITRRISGSNMELVLAFADWGRRCEAPLAGDIVCCHRAQYVATVINGYDAAFLCATFQGWRGVIGETTASH